MEFGLRLGSRVVGFCTLIASMALAAPATPLPFADDFAARGEIAGAAGKGTVNNRGATREVGEPKHADSRTQSTIWVSWVAPFDGVMSLVSRNSDFRTVIGVYANQDALLNPGLPTTLINYGLTQLSEVAASSVVKNDRQASQTSFPVQQGVRYEIAVAGVGKAQGPIDFTWKLKASSQPLPSVVSHARSSSGQSSDRVDLSYDVRYKGNVRFQWLRNGQEVDGATGSRLTIKNLTADDVGAYILRITVPPLTPRGEVTTLFTKPVEVQMSSGASLGMMAVDSLEAALAQSDDSIPDDSDPGANRNAGRAFDLPPIPVSGLTRSYTGSQVFSTTQSISDPAEPLHCGLYGGASYWNTYTPTVSGTLTFNTRGSTYNTILAIYTYNAAIGGYAGLVPVTCNNDAPGFLTSEVTFPAVAGTKYFVIVDGVNAARGTVALNYYYTPAAPVIQSGPASQTVSLGTSATFSVSAPGYYAQTYQWRFNGAPLAGATGTSYTVSSSAAASIGRYDVLVKNVGGTTTSAPAQLTVQQAGSLSVSGAPRASVAIYADGVGISCPSQSGVTYALQYRSALTTGSWQTLQTRLGTGAVITFVDSSSTSLRIFRIVTQ